MKRKPLTRADVTPAEMAHFATCVHESAHATVGVVLGADVRSAVTIATPTLGIQGRTDFYEHPHGSLPLIRYAGVFGQAKFLAGGRRPTQRAVFALLDAGGRCDRDELHLAGGTHLGHDAVPIIDRTWPAILRVAGDLYKRGEVTEKDILGHLGVTDVSASSPARNSVQLASIRSGCRLVPA